jgi:hypothetical protein
VTSLPGLPMGVLEYKPAESLGLGTGKMGHLDETIRTLCRPDMEPEQTRKVNLHILHFKVQVVE